MAHPDSRKPGGREFPAEMNRRADDPRWSQIHERMESFDAAIREQRAVLDANTSMTKEIKTNTDEIVQFFQAGKGFFAVVRATGALAKWVTAIAAAFAIGWALTKYGIAQALEDIRKGKP